MKPIHEIRQIKEAKEDELLKLPGVTGVDTGKKYVKGNKTDEIAIRVYVKKKEDVPREQMILKEINGVKTDVIEREFVLARLDYKLADRPLTVTANNPLLGGIMIGPCREVGNQIHAGTLGIPVVERATYPCSSSGRPMMLSCWHVMYLDDNGQPGDQIVQPAIGEGFPPANCGSGDGPAGPWIVGSLQRGSLGGTVDCAVADIIARDYVCAIADVGGMDWRRASVASVALGEAVSKCGCSTYVTHGTVESIDLTQSVNYDTGGITGVGTITLKNQIQIAVDPSQTSTGIFVSAGDSGSVVFNGSNQVVGLLYAGSADGSWGVANPINDVLNTLNVDICPLLIPPKAHKDSKDIVDHIHPSHLGDHPKPWDISEGAKLPEQPPVQPREQAFSHFIGRELRPDLSYSAIMNEQDIQTSESALYQKHTTKLSKDSKDMEKITES